MWWVAQQTVPTCKTPRRPTDPIAQLRTEAPLFADLKQVLDTVNSSIIDVCCAAPAPTCRPGQATPAAHQLFSSTTGDWVVEVDTFSNPDKGLRWMHTVTSAKVVPGLTLGLLRTNAALDATVTAAPALDVEVGLFNNASILFYLNMPPRVDLLVRRVDFATQVGLHSVPMRQAEHDEEYYHRYYMQPVGGHDSYDALMAVIASDPETAPFRSKSVHIRTYAATGALVTVRPRVARHACCQQQRSRCPQRQRA